MEKKMTWEEIRKQYDQEWVELVEYDWPDTEPFPRDGVVRVHAKSRREFDVLILEDPPIDSALIFVGERQAPPGVVLNANLHHSR